MKYKIGKEIEFYTASKDCKRKEIGNEFLIPEHPELKLAINKTGRNYTITEMNTGAAFINEYKTYMEDTLDILIPKMLDLMNTERYKTLVEHYNSIPFEDEYLVNKTYMDLGFVNRKEYFMSLSTKYDIPQKIMDLLIDVEADDDSIIKMMKLYKPMMTVA